jgi:hypothetical protein
MFLLMITAATMATVDAKVAHISSNATAFDNQEMANAGGGGGTEGEWGGSSNNAHPKNGNSDYFAAQMQTFRSPAALHAGKLAGKLEASPFSAART